MISGFTFLHNGILGGYPFVQAIEAVRPYVDEIVAVDIESTDDTPQILKAISDRVLSSTWDGRDTTPRAFLKYVECKGDIIVFFEADEVYDDSLLSAILWEIDRGHDSIAVWRLQLEQNFQRCRQYPIPVHRVFPKGGSTYHLHPTNLPDSRYPIHVLPPDAGYLWDCSNIFKDSWFERKRQQSEIWGEPRPLMVAQHFTEPVELSPIEEEDRLNDPCWEWTSSPFRLPGCLKKLVGKTRYTVEI